MIYNRQNLDSAFNVHVRRCLYCETGTPAEKLKKVIEASGMTLQAFAEAMQFRVSMLEDILHNHEMNTWHCIDAQELFGFTAEEMEPYLARPQDKIFLNKE